MSAAEPTLLAYFTEIVTGLFPFLARITIDPATKALSIRSASETIAIDATERIDVGEHAKAVALAGGSLPVARKNDGTGFRYLQVIIAGGVVTSVVEYWSPDNGGASAWTPVAGSPAPPINGVTMGTPEHITGGSAKVSSG